MSDYGDDDDGYSWMYVEDYWDEANELAEHTCPSPVLHEELVHEDYDYYDYWQDIDYISDGGYYEDHQSPATKRKMKTQSLRRPNKRRRQEGTSSQTGLGTGPISWITHDERQTSQHQAPLITSEDAHSFALLKDWHKRFKDAPGLASPPQSELDTDNPEEQISGDGFDLGDLQSIAGLLSEDNIDTLQEILKAKGLDPAAVEAVLQDLVSGKEREFDDADDAEDDEPDEAGEAREDERPEPAADEANPTTAKASHQAPTAAIGAAADNLTTPRTAVPPAQNSLSSEDQLVPSARRTKRKDRMDDGSADLSDNGPMTRRKRQRGKHHESEPNNSATDMIKGPMRSEESTKRARASRLAAEPPEDTVTRTRSGRAIRRR